MKGWPGGQPCAAQEVAPTNLLFPTGKHSEIDLICRQLPCAAGDCTAFIVCQANPSKSATTFMHNLKIKSIKIMGKIIK